MSCRILAWQQHDVQELCRVMFDALESSFKGTDQVMCLEILWTVFLNCGDL